MTIECKTFIFCSYITKCGEHMPLQWSPCLATNAQVSHTSFIHGDGRYFASSLAISESIKTHRLWKLSILRGRKIALFINMPASRTQTITQESAAVVSSASPGAALTTIRHIPSPHCSWNEASPTKWLSAPYNISKWGLQRGLIGKMSFEWKDDLMLFRSEEYASIVRNVTKLKPF